MTKDKFWELVKSTNWEEESKKDKISFDEMKFNLLLQMSPLELQSFTDHYSTAYKEISKVTSLALKDTDAYVSDDSFSDLVSHVVGLGKEKSDDLINNPEFINEMAESNSYEESFSYVVPFIGDYEKLDFASYGRKAREYQEITESSTIKSNLGDQMVVDMFLKAVVDYDFEELPLLCDKVYDYWYSKAGREANLSVHITYPQYGLPNLAGDIRTIIPILKKLNGGL